METLRWITAFIFLAIAAIYTGFNLFLACRKLWLFTFSGPSNIPVVGFVTALLGMLAVPKNETTLSTLAVGAGCAFLCFDFSPHFVDLLNLIREKLTGRRPS